jgi:2-dehydrotetronate isomerase
MPRFAANLSTMYPEHALLARADAAAHDGFVAVEVQGPYAVQAAELRRALEDARVRLVLMNAPAGNADAGDRGLAALPGREREFEQAIARALDYARTVGAPRLHVQAGRPDSGMAADDCLRTYLRNLAYACDALRPHGITVTIEPINPRDIPGYYLQRPQQAADVIAALRKDNLGLQLDFYHLQIVEGDLIRHFERHYPLVAHVQIAGVPERHEPDRGEVHYPAVFAALDRLQYPGWVGCEYRPAVAAAGGTSAGLGWLRRL